MSRPPSEPTIGGQNLPHLPHLPQTWKSPRKNGVGPGVGPHPEGYNLPHNLPHFSPGFPAVGVGGVGGVGPHPPFVGSGSTPRHSGFWGRWGRWGRLSPPICRLASWRHPLAREREPCPNSNSPSGLRPSRRRVGGVGVGLPDPRSSGIWTKTAQKATS